MIKILLGGSPCTFWSIAQKNNRETEAEGLGWELFKNYLIAKEKFKPDVFLYENNVSAAKAIKEQIKKEFKVPDQANYIEINSALVSAQNRKRFYVHNCGDVGQPEDRGILLKDVLESGEDLTGNDKSFCIQTRIAGAAPHDTIKRHRHNMVAERVDEKLIVKEATKKGYTEIEPGDCVDMTQPNSKTRRGRNMKEKSNCLMTSNQYYQYIGTIDKPIYEVKDGKINIKGKEYPIKLIDGYYIIRKLTPIECERLQTLPDNYTAAVSNAQRYKGLGNGWTAEVIIHILNGALKDIPRDEEIVVLSMYDGIATGRYCLDKMGFTNVKYFAYEIDKYAKEVAMSNYPDIIQMGDAFKLREPDWTIGY